MPPTATNGSGQRHAPGPDHGPAESGWAALPPEYAIPAKAPSLDAARHYCERLARSHYENFSVATRFLPARLRPHFYSVYAYCRIADDLGDEVGNAEASLRLLDQWEAELDATYGALERTADSGSGASESATVARPAPRHPVFLALGQTIRECQIPKEPFADLLRAFRQDQLVHRYETFEDLLGYCRNSANPVGRLVLYVCGYRDSERQRLSDFTCTALQLANFWQDVTLDYRKGRIYLPLEDLRRFGVSEQDIAAGRATREFLEMMRFQVQRAREWFTLGLPLAGMVDRSLSLDIELFTRGGLEILKAIERQNYDVLKARPAISTRCKLWLVASALLKLKMRIGRVRRGEAVA